MTTPPPAIEVSPKLGEAMEVLRELVAAFDRMYDPPREGDAAHPATRMVKALAAARALFAAPIAPAVEQEK